MDDLRELTVQESLLAKSIGREVLKYVESRGVDVGQSIHDEAVELLEKIRAILDDDSLTDPECFRRIDAMVDAFHNAGISTLRHDW